MPRPLRIEYENAWYHVMNRGANRQLIYHSSANRKLFYSILGEIVDQFNIEIHAFCLMNNHYHLLIKTPKANLGKAMRHLDGVYTQRLNRRTGRDGPLFRGRYIHLNPVEANICECPSKFKWSSYHSYVNEKQSIAWLQTEHNEVISRQRDYIEASNVFFSNIYIRFTAINPGKKKHKKNTCGLFV